MLEAGIKPVFVFDGEPPEMKKKELAKRSLKRDDAIKDLNRAMEVSCSSILGMRMQLKNLVKGLSRLQEGIMMTARGC